MRRGNLTRKFGHAIRYCTPNDKLITERVKHADLQPLFQACFTEAVLLTTKSVPFFFSKKYDNEDGTIVKILKESVCADLEIKMEFFNQALSTV